MRSLTAVLLGTVAVLPALGLGTLSPAADVANGATHSSAPSASALDASALDPGRGLEPAGPVAQAGPAGPKVQAHPVATKVTDLALAPVSAVAARSIGAAAAGSAAVLSRAAGTVSFQTLGVSWASRSAEPDLAITVRTHSSKGWSAWATLDSDSGDDAAATGPGVRGGTDPLWVGPSDGVQARIGLRWGRLPEDLKLELVDPGSSSYDAIAASTAPGSTALAAPVTGAGAVAATSASEPAVLSRASWGADEGKVRNAPTYMPTIKAAVMHHTAGPNNYTAAQVPSIIRGDYAYHLSRGWSDIGYNALVDRFGRIWEGRAGGLSQAVMGAHAGGFNTDTFGVAVIGNYDVARPTLASVTAVARVMAWKLDLYHRDPFGTTQLTSAGGGTARWKGGTTVTLPVIMGHRNTGNTACPGRYLYPYLPSIRAQVKALMKAALTNPTGPPASVLRGSKMSITAGSLVAQTWQLDVTAPCGAGRVARITGSAKAGAEITASWNGKLTNGSVAAPGRYTLTLTSSSSTGSARPLVDTVLVVPPTPVAVPAATPSKGAGGYQPLTPVRLLDTRTSGQRGLGPAGRVDVPVLGRGGVPSTGVTAVVLNLTATCVSDDTALTVWAAGAPSSRPVTAVPAGATRSVLVTSRVGANGEVSIGNAHGVTQLTADVVGYYGVGGPAIQPIGSTRLYDSRIDPAGPVTVGQPRLIPLPAMLGTTPSDQVKAVMVDVSALSPTGTGTLTAYPPGDVAGPATLNYGKGASVDNLAIVPVSGGQIALQATGTAVSTVLDVRGVILDAVVGSAAGAGAFTAVKPTLVLDTTTTGGAVKPGSPRKVVVTGAGTAVPAGASAVLIDLTGIDPSAATWLQAYPWGGSTPIGAAVRVAAGDTRGNLVLVPVGTGGAIGIANARGLSQLRFDVVGYVQ